jgi:actin cytoskeleton-regulatory complex protein SLA1
MSEEQEEYIAVLKASYDYAPQSEDEIEIKEDQLLLLIEKIDDECVPLSSYPICS